MADAFSPEDLELDAHLEEGDIIDDTFVTPEKKDDGTGDDDSVEKEESINSSELEVIGEEEAESKEKDSEGDNKEESEEDEDDDEDGDAILSKVSKLEEADKYKVLSSIANELGIVEGDLKSADDLLSMMDDFYVSSIPDEYKQLLVALRNGAPLNTLLSESQSAFDYEQVKEEDIEEDSEVAKDIYRKYLEDTGVNKGDIDGMVNYAVDSEVIVKKALAARKTGIEMHKTAVKEMDEKAIANTTNLRKQNDERIAGIKANVDKTKELWGNKVSDVDRLKLFDMLAKPVEIRENNGTRIPITALNKAIEGDPSILLQINYLLNKGVLGQDGKLDALSVKLHHKVAEEVEKVTKSKKNKRGTNKTEEAIDKNYADGISGLSNLFQRLKL